MRLVIFAGPNGAGKTTHAEAILSTLGISTFVNADYIARGLSGPREASAAFDVPGDVIRRRFDRSIVNLFGLYAPLADEWHVFDNSRKGLARPIASHDGRVLTVKDADRWEKLQSKLKCR